VSDPIDIKALDEYLKANGSSDISQRYRELDREDVPPELDRRVLEAARAAVDDARPSRSWLRWSAPVALAASLVLVVTVVIESGVQKDATIATQAPAAELKRDTGGLEPASVRVQAEQDRSYRQSVPQLPAEPAQFVPEEPVMIAPVEAYSSAAIAEPAPAPASAAPPASLAKAESQRTFNAAFEEVRVNAKALDDQSQALPVTTDSSVADSGGGQFAAEQPVPQLAGSVDAVAARKEVLRAQAQANDSSDASEVSVTGARTRRATGRTAGPRNTISGAGALSSETRPADSAEQSDPEKWLEDIRELRRAGKTAVADREWQHFRSVFPDFSVAADDIARKRR
jgi:hypothetical protein